MSYMNYHGHIKTRFVTYKVKKIYLFTQITYKTEKQNRYAKAQNKQKK
jgi:hypothetical protein